MFFLIVDKFCTVKIKVLLIKYMSKSW